MKVTDLASAKLIFPGLIDASPSNLWAHSNRQDPTSESQVKNLAESLVTALSSVMQLGFRACYATSGDAWI